MLLLTAILLLLDILLYPILIMKNKAAICMYMYIYVYIPFVDIKNFFLSYI